MIVSAHRLNELLDATLDQLEMAESQLDRLLEVIRERDALSVQVATLREEAQRERAAVFEYLCQLAVNSDTVEMERTLLEAARDIHSGEHRCEEEP